MPRLEIAETHRFLQKEDGSPFVWIGGTNWFFAKLPPTTIDSILRTRSKQGFTIMQVSCRERLYNGEGPGSIDQPNEQWWSYLDDYIRKYEELGLYVGITLGWWSKAMDHGKEDIYNYGKWVGHRYKDSNNIVWLTLGEAGSHSRKGEIPLENLQALVKGIKDGDTGNKLLTIHADYQRGTSLSNHSDLCDFNNWQTGQWEAPMDLPRKGQRILDGTVWDVISFDYGQRYGGRPKPTLDMEAIYERNKDFCGATPFMIRRRAYFTIFAGAFGHTYGAGGIWDGLTNAQGCSEAALQALQYEGGIQIGHLGRFLQGLGAHYPKLRPHQDIVTEGNSADYGTHIQAMLAVDTSFSLIYSASDDPYSLDLSKLSWEKLQAIWYNPRNHTYTKLPTKDLKTGEKTQVFDPPGHSGAGNDWVLMLGEERVLNTFQISP